MTAYGVTHSNARHDLFAVGIVLHQLPTGAHPFEADSDLAQTMAILSGLPEKLELPPGRDPPALVALVRRLLAEEVTRETVAAFMAP